jgi:hypothetical protein
MRPTSKCRPQLSTQERPFVCYQRSRNHKPGTRRQVYCDRERLHGESQGGDHLYGRHSCLSLDRISPHRGCEWCLITFSPRRETEAPMLSLIVDTKTLQQPRYLSSIHRFSLSPATFAATTLISGKTLSNLLAPILPARQVTNTILFSATP